MGSLFLKCNFSPQRPKEVLWSVCTIKSTSEMVLTHSSNYMVWRDYFWIRVWQHHFQDVNSSPQRPKEVLWSVCTVKCTAEMVLAHHNYFTVWGSLFWIAISVHKYLNCGVLIPFFRFEFQSTDTKWGLGWGGIQLEDYKGYRKDIYGYILVFKGG